MTKQIFGIFLWLNCLLVFAAPSETDVLGVWVNQAGDGLIEISKSKDKINGVIIGSTDPDSPHRKDIHNPDPNLRTRPLLGVTILGNLTYQGDNEWDDGWVYDPNNGKVYDCELTLEDKNTLSIRGYIGAPLFGRTETWTRKSERKSTH